MAPSRIDQLNENLGPQPGSDPESAETPPTVIPGDRLQASIEAERDSIEQKLADVEREEAQYENAKTKLLSRIRQLRTGINRDAAGMDDEEREQFVASEVKAAAAEFKDSEQLAVLKKLMPDLPSADTARQKFTALIAMGLKLSFWDRSNFLHRYERMFGEDIDDEFVERSEGLIEELEHLDEEEDELAKAA